MMNIEDYLIDQEGLDWPEILTGWTHVLPGEFSPWLVNRFGDLFLIPDDGSVHRLDVSLGTLEKLAESCDDFARMVDEPGRADDWLLIPLVDRLIEAGMGIRPGECYSFVIPPVLGGKYVTENIRPIPIAEHYGIYAYYHEQIRDLPDGAKVKLNVVD